MNSVSRSKKEWLKENLDKMDIQEHSQVYSIIKKYNTQVTKTQNGVLISADGLSDDCLLEIEKYIHFSLDQKKRMDEDMKRRKEYERMI